MRNRWSAVLAAAGVFTLVLTASAQGPGGQAPPAQVPGGAGRGGQGGRGGGRFGQAPPVTGPWSDKTLSPDQRAALLLGQMTLDEKISILHGGGMGGFGGPAAPATPGASVSNGGAGFTQAVPRLGIPAIQMADAAVGVTRGASNSRYSTALPNAISAASSWDVKMACAYGGLIGQELRDQGYTMSLGGGVNITREPRNGRNFEYKGEDPILAGTLVGQEMKCLQAKGIIGDIKHFAANDQETGRNIGNAILDKRTLRETDLLPFEIGIKDGDIQAVMCSYNKVNGDWSCENQYLLNDFLKGSVGFKGFVLSDWGGTHTTTKAALAGLDMEQPGNGNFGEALKQAVEKGEVPMARLDDMVKRILRAQFATGQFDLRTQRKVVDVFAGLEVAQQVAERGTVLLKNSNHQLPLNKSLVKSIAVIGSHADVGVISGGGSAQVNPPGGNAVPPPPPPAGQQGGRGMGGMFGGAVWYPSSPLKAIQAKAPNAKVKFNEGTDVAAAAALAKSSEIAIVFVNQPASEGRDLSLTLPDGQDKLVDAVVAANPHTIVILETGGPVDMPWADKVPGIMEAWFPGIRGGEAIANILFGTVNPSAKTVLSFAKKESDWPFDKVFSAPVPVLAPGAQATGGPGGFGGGRGAQTPFDVPYAKEGLKVGYKWFDSQDIVPLFPFGHGLSYTTFAYSGLKTISGKETKITFTVRNTGTRAGIEIAQVYATLPSGTNEPPKRLVGWESVPLKASESKLVTLTIPALHLSIFNESKDDWQLVAGDYKFWVGGSSRSLPLSQTVQISD